MRKVVRHWSWWLPALVIGAGGLYGVYRATHPPWAGTEAWAKYQQIRMGMTAKEVDAILGERPYRLEEMTTTTTTFTWRGGEDRVIVELDRREGVHEKSAFIAGRVFVEPDDKISWWDRLRDRLGW